tara:strand:+ start:291 stop:569 length:279 start_codon:yes stop_codon:yes gene_type:complete
MKTSRIKFSSNFKTKVVLEALKEKSTLQELSSKYELQSTQISKWKKEFIENASASFDSKKKKNTESIEEDKLFSKIAQLRVEIDFLKHVLGK